ncbi:MAG: alpha/beta hydrolase [Planctomycetota bacterium]
MRRRLIFISLLLVGGYASVVALFAVFQERLIFPGAFRSSSASLPDRAGVTYGTVPLPGEQGEVRIATAGSVDAPMFCVGFLGNNEHLGAGMAMAVEFARYGVRATFVEPPGYGESSGEPSVDSFHAAAVAVTRRVRQEARGRPVLAFGASLGTFPAVHCAARGLVDRVFLASPPASLIRVSNDRYPWLRASWFLRHRFDSESVAPLIAVPLLVIHGDRDRTVPFTHGQLLVDRWGGPARLLRAEDRGHNDLDLRIDGPFGNQVAEFLAR